MSALGAIKQVASLSRLCVLHDLPNLGGGPMYLSVRYKKPRWVPKSKSKEFYVRVRTPIDPVEYEELKEGYAQYRTSVKAIRRYLIQSYQPTKSDIKVEAEVDSKAEMIKKMIEDNNAWNSKIASAREARILEEEVARAGLLQQAVDKETERKMKMMEEAEKKVMDEIEESRTFITLENLDQAIEQVLDQRSDHNFAIDKEGNKITELDATLPSSPQEAPGSRGQVQGRS